VVAFSATPTALPKMPGTILGLVLEGVAIEKKRAGHGIRTRDFDLGNFALD
jgi:hypothetical protein